MNIMFNIMSNIISPTAWAVIKLSIKVKAIIIINVGVMKVMIGRLVVLFEALQTPSLGLLKALQGEREFMLKWSLSLTLALSFWSTYKCHYHSYIGRIPFSS